MKRFSGNVTRTLDTDLSWTYPDFSHNKFQVCCLCIRLDSHSVVCFNRVDLGSSWLVLLIFMNISCVIYVWILCVFLCVYLLQNRSRLLLKIPVVPCIVKHTHVTVSHSLFTQSLFNQSLSCVRVCCLKVCWNVAREHMHLHTIYQHIRTYSCNTTTFQMFWLSTKKDEV